MWVCLLALVNLCLVGWCLAKIVGTGPHADPALEGKINAVLFWGGIGAVMGILGQCSGLYLGVRAILGAAEIDPNVVAEGFAISFLPTLFGLMLLLGSALAWFLLRSIYGRKTRAVVAA